jgi:hypothetical protein
MSLSTSSGSRFRRNLRPGWMLRLVTAILLLCGSVTVGQPAAAAGPPPMNDNFANARVLVEQGLYGHLPMVDSTVEPTDPVSDPATNGTVWFRMPVTASGTLSVGIYGVYDTTGGPALTNYKVFKGPAGAASSAALTVTTGGAAVVAGQSVWVMAETDHAATAGVLSLSIRVFPDTDGDGVLDDYDNCINVVNANQSDTTLGGRVEGDGYGDACEPVGVPANDRERADARARQDRAGHDQRSHGQPNCARADGQP